MIIKCEHSNGYNRFLVEGIGSIEELLQYVKNNKPVLCKEVGSPREGNIYLFDEISEKQLVYLDNYLNIKESEGIFVSRYAFRKLYHEQCSNCEFFDDWSNCWKFNPDESSRCTSFEPVREFSLLEWVKSRFKSK